MPKITELVELTAIDIDDLLAVVDDPGGTPITKKITQGNLLQLEYGQIYTTGAIGTQTPGVAFVPVDQWASNGLSTPGVTPDQANDKIILVETGIYVIMFQVSFEGTGASVVDLQIEWNGVNQTQISCQRKLGVGGDVGSASAIGLLDVTSTTTDLELEVKCDGGGDVFDLIEGQLTAIRIGPT